MGSGTQSELLLQTERWEKGTRKKKKNKTKPNKTLPEKQKHRNINTHLRQSKLQVAAI